MADTVTKVTRQSWGSRIKGSFSGAVFGFILVAIAFWLLFSNEGRAVRRYKALKEGARVVVSVASTAANPANENKLIHLSGTATTTETLRDPDFRIAARAIHLQRSVEMYQWLESQSSKTEKKVGGSTETTVTYSYRRGWSDRLVDSNSFEDPAGHRNPSTLPYQSASYSASAVTVGAFNLSTSLIRSINQWSDLPMGSTGGIRGARLYDGGLYIGFDPASPRVGDLKVSFRQVLPAEVSIVARQSGSALSSYSTRSGGTIQLLRYGRVSADDMFVAAQKANKVLTWILRVVGFFIMVFGLSLILGPLSVIADFIPAIGNLVAKGTSAIAMGCALPLSLVTIAIAWIFYRPLLAVAILLPAAAIAGFVLIRSRRGGEDKAVPPPPPPPPPKPAD